MFFLHFYGKKVLNISSENKHLLNYSQFCLGHASSRLFVGTPTFLRCVKVSRVIPAFCRLGDP